MCQPRGVLLSVRKQIGVTIRELAKSAGVSDRTLYRLDQKHRMSDETVIAVSEALIEAGISDQGLLQFLQDYEKACCPLSLYIRHLEEHCER